MTGIFIAQGEPENIQSGTRSFDNPAPWPERVGQIAKTALEETQFSLLEKNNPTYTKFAPDANGMMADRPKISPEEAKKNYGIDTGGDWVTDLQAGAIAQIQEDKNKIATMERGAGFLNRLSAQMVGSMADPINAAAALVPIPGAAELTAAKLGFTMTKNAAGETIIASRTARAASRALAGGVVGAAITAPLEAVSAYEDAQIYVPHTFADSLRDVAFNFGMGAVGHVLTGAFGDAVRSLHDTAVDTRLAAMRTSIAQMLDERPIETHEVFDAATMDSARSLSKTEILERLSRAPDKPTFISRLKELGITDITPRLAQQIDRWASAKDKGASAAQQAHEYGVSLDMVKADLASRLTDPEKIALIDPATAERLRIIDDELASTIPAARREQLQSEREMLTSGEQFKTEHLPTPEVAELKQAQTTYQAEIARHAQNSARYDAEVKRRISDIINSEKQLRENGSIMGVTPERMQAMKVQHEEAPKEAKAQTPDKEMSFNEEMNKYMEDMLKDHAVEPEYQEALKTTEALQTMTKAIQAATSCLGRP